MKREEALLVADRMIEYLRPACIGFEPGRGLGMIEIAGSLRRGKAEIDEIDLVLIPDLSPPPRPRAEFGKPVPKVYETGIDKLIDELDKAGEITITQNGPRSKKFIYRSGIRFDLYLVRPPATWGVQYAIRTGPREFSHWIVTRRSGRAVLPNGSSVRGGALPDGYRVQGGAVWEGETKVPDKELLELEPVGFETEESFLDWLGLGWVFPEDRVAKWNK
jgi:hypothetical protein